MFPKYPIILFDADGTLLDFAKTEDFALQKTFSNHNIVLTSAIKDRYKQINAQLWSDFEQGYIEKAQLLQQRFTKLFSEFQISYDGSIFNEEYLNNIGNGFYTIDGAERVCRMISPYCSLYFATNGNVSTQLKRIAGSGLGKYFLNIFVSEMAGEPKPSPVFFEYCFSHIPNFQKDKTLIVGDSLFSDVYGGHSAGISTCWFNPQKQARFNDIHPDYEIHSLEELLPILFH